MSDPLGKKLKQARLKKGYSIEDVAHQTRIPEAAVRRLEENDYSGFPNTAYARGFVSIYSNFLEVDAWETLQTLTPRGKKPTQGESSPPLNLTPSDTIIPVIKSLGREVPRASGSPYTVMLLVLLMMTIPSVYLVGKRVGSHESGLVREAPGSPASALPIAEKPGLPAPAVIIPQPDQPPVLKPDPVFNDLIGVGATSAKARPIGFPPEPTAATLSPGSSAAPSPSPGPGTRQISVSANGPGQESHQR